MGIMVDSLLWVMQDLNHQQYEPRALDLESSAFDPWARCSDNIVVGIFGSSIPLSLIK